jgi:prepilin signal peptidase PulO-like enzyme (type II secretory pathway)
MIAVLFFFVLGLTFWSFGSVFLQRMDKKITLPIIKSFIYGRSECPHCHHTLHRWNLIPLVSRFRQKGKCEYCKVSVSTIYPVLEIVSGIIFALWSMIYWHDFSTGLLWSGVFIILVLRRLLVLMLVWDMYTYELHVPAWFISIVTAVIYGLILWIWWSADLYLISSSVVFLLVFASIYYLGKRYAKIRFGVSQEAFGQWDVMLAPILGYLFALWGMWWTSVFSQQFIMFILFFVLWSCVVGLLYYAIVVFLQKMIKRTWLPDMTHETGTPMIPFLPAMIIMYWVVVIRFSLV